MNPSKTRRMMIGRCSQASLLAAVATLMTGPCLAQNGTVQLQGYSGLPAQIKPTYFEVGYGSGPLHHTGQTVTATGTSAALTSAPNSSATTATTTASTTPADTGSSSSTGTSTQSTTGTNGGAASATADASASATASASASASVSAANSTALDTMMATPWGAQAASNAQALGVNPSAVAATCVVESGCQNVSGTGSITGAFQMTSGTYRSSMNAAMQENPTLAENAVSGIAGQNDPATQSIAAAEYLKQGAQYLQSQNVSNPTVLDVRGYYNFGPQAGAAVANAPDSTPIAQVLPMYTQSQLAANGISQGETVGQWRAGVASKIGNAASQPVLTQQG